MHVLKPSFAASFTFKVDGVPGASRRFIGKVKKQSGTEGKGTIPWDLCKKERGGWWRKHRRRREGGGGETERESLPPSLSTEEDQRFVLCITMDIRSPILMSPGVWCFFHRAYILWVNKWSLHGNQWMSFPPFYLTAQLPAVTAFA